MKRNLLTIILLLIIAPFVHAQINNYPLPSNPDTLRILAIGNSFSDDGTEYLPALLEGAGVKNVIVGRLYIGGCTLERHCKEYAESKFNYIYSKSTQNKWVVKSKSASLVEGLKDESWDIITMQEASGISGIYDNYAEWLPKLINIVRKEATNPHASIVWHMTWAYAENSHHGEFPNYNRNQFQMYRDICSCVSKLQKDFNIQVVIPSGVAVQQARATRLNNDKYVSPNCSVYQLTRDGYHLGHQFGRYIAACTWFETLIRPTLGVSVKDNDYLLRDTDYSLCKKDAKLCRNIAIKAVRLQEK